MDLSAGDIMARDPVCLPPIVKVGKVFDLLRERKHHCFPVVAQGPSEETSGVMVGTVARKILTTLILHKAFGFSGEESLA